MIIQGACGASRELAPFTPYLVQPPWWAQSAIAQPEAQALTNAPALWKWLSEKHPLPDAKVEVQRARQLEIRLRTAVCMVFPQDRGAIQLHSERLAVLYGELRDAPNMAHWTHIAMHQAADTNRIHAMVKTILRQEGDVDGIRSALLDLVGEELAKAAPDIRPALADALVEIAISAGAPDRLAKAFAAAGINPTQPQIRRILPTYAVAPTNATLGPWLRKYLERESDAKEINSCVRNFAAASSDMNLPVLYQTVEKCAAEIREQERFRTLVSALAEQMLARADVIAFKSFYDRNRTRLEADLKWETVQWRMRVALMEQDDSAASEILELAAQVKPDFTNSVEYREYQRQIVGLLTPNTKPQVEFMYDAVEKELRDYSRDSDKSRLYQLVNRTLIERGGYCIQAESDRNLFTGAKASYRALFDKACRQEAGFDEGYRDYASNKLEWMALDAPDSLRLIEGLRRAGRLDTPYRKDVSKAKKDAGSIKAPKGNNPGFMPLLEMPAGIIEATGNEQRFQLCGAGQVLWGGAVVAGEYAVVQNSRLLMVLNRDGQFRWGRRMALGQIWPSARSKDLFCMGGKYVPALAGSTLGALLVVPDKGPVFCGFDIATGRLRWSFWERGIRLASSPAAWAEGFVVVAVRSAAIPSNTSYEMIALDGENGRVLMRFPLAFGPPLVETTWDRNPVSYEGYWTMPPPTVADDVAYIDTSAGILGAIDLADQALLWCRSYARRADLALLARREAGAPIIGSNTAFFAPIDSRTIFLVDRTGGELIRQRTDIPWTTFGPAGDERVAMTTADSTRFIRLDNLADARAVRGSDMRYRQFLGDGCLIGSTNLAHCFNADGSSAGEFGAPSGIEVAFMHAGKLFGFEWNRKIFGLLDSRQAASQRSAPALPVGSRFEMSYPPRNAAAWQADGGIVRIGDLVRRLDAKGRIMWEVAVPRQAMIEYNDDYFAYATMGRIWLLDAKSGSVRRVIPEIEGASPSVWRMFSTVSSLYAFSAPIGYDTVLYDLHPMSNEPCEAIGKLPANLITLGWNYFATRQSNQCLVAAYGAWSGIYLATNVISRPRGAELPAFNWIIPNDVGNNLRMWMAPGRSWCIMFSIPQKRLWRLRAEGFAAEKLPDDSPLLKFATTAGNLIELRDQKVTTYFDPVTERSSSLRREREFIICSRGTATYGMRFDKLFGPPTSSYSSQVACVQNDLAISTNWNEAPAIYVPFPFSGIQDRGQFNLAGRHFKLICPSMYADNFIYAVTWPHTNVVASVIPFPPIDAEQPLLQLSGDLAYIGLSTIQDEDCEAFLRPMARRLPPAEGVRNIPQIDGFHDEWEPGEFMEMSRGRIALRSSTNAPGYWMAVEITDADLVRRIADNGGLDGKLEFAILNGRNAGFNAGGLEGIVLHDKIDGRRNSVFAFTLTPDGRHCRFEIYSSFVPTAPRKNDWYVFPPVAALFGNIAIRLIWRADVFSAGENVLESHEHGPLSFSRVTF